MGILVSRMRILSLILLSSFLIVICEWKPTSARSHMHTHLNKSKKTPWIKRPRRTAFPLFRERLVLLNVHNEPRWVDWNYIFDLLRGKQRYLDVTDLPNLPTKRNSIMANVWKRMSHPIPTKTKLESVVTERIGAVKKDRIREFVKHFSSYTNRLATNILGMDSQQWLRSIIKSIVDETVTLYEVPLDIYVPTYFYQKSLIVQMEGSDFFLRDEVIIIGAHCDSINVGSKPCLTPECLTMKAPGADDNASGVSVIVEALRVLKDTLFKRTVEFHFYAGGEYGLRGALATAAAYKEMGRPVVGMVSFDMVGHGSNPIAIHTKDTHPELNRFLKLLIDKYLKDVGWVDKNEKESILSDHAAWSTYTYASAYVSESTPSPYYHTVNDTVDNLNFEYIANFAKLAVAYLIEFGEAMGSLGPADYDSDSSINGKNKTEEVPDHGIANEDTTPSDVERCETEDVPDTVDNKGKVPCNFIPKPTEGAPENSTTANGNSGNNEQENSQNLDPVKAETEDGIDSEKEETPEPVTAPGKDEADNGNTEDNSASDEGGWIPLRPGKDLGPIKDESQETRVILRGNETKVQTVTEEEIESFLLQKGLVSFMDITDCPLLWKKIVDDGGKQTQAQTLPIPTVIRYEEDVKKLINVLSISRIERSIEEGTHYPNRLAFFNYNGQDYSKYLYRDKMRWLVDKYQGLYKLSLLSFARGKHQYPQENVILSIDGSDDNLKDEIIILGAHTDSISSPRTSGCLTTNCLTKDAQGADDNMSGVAVLIECINALVFADFRPKRTVEFHFYAGSEHGLLGSAMLADLYLRENRKVVGMVNFDMIGYAPTAADFKIAIATENTNPKLNEFIKLLTKAYLNISIEEKALQCPNCDSDYIPWTKAGFPAAFPHEDKLNPFIHTPNDTVETLNVDLIMEFAKLGVAYMVEYGEVERAWRNCSGIEYWNTGSISSNTANKKSNGKENPRRRRSHKRNPKRKRRDHLRKGRKRFPREKHLILIDLEQDPVLKNEDELNEMEIENKNFVDVSSDPSALAGTSSSSLKARKSASNNSSLSTPSSSSSQYPIPTEIRYLKETEMFLKKVYAYETRFTIENCIIDIGTQVPSRYASNPNGKNASTWVLNMVKQWIEQYTTDCISLFEVEHEKESQGTVILRIVGADKNLSSQVIILGAHLDSITKDCLKNKNSCETPGADDASGLCTLIAIINTINNRKMFPRRTIEFHFYAASKEGSKGAYKIAAEYKRMGVNVVGMLNLGLIGYSSGKGSDANKIRIQTKDVNPELTEFVKMLIDEYCNTTWEDSDSCSNCTSDYMAWSATGFPVALPYEAIPNPNIHSVRDTFDILNYDYIQDFLKLGLAFVMEYGEPYEVHTPYIHQPQMAST